MEKTERKWSARITDGRTIGRKCAFVVGLHNDSAYEDCIASIELNHKEDADGWFEKYFKIAECMNAHSELQAKAASYDRLMSGGLSMKELANVLKHPVAIDNDEGQNTLYYFGTTPHIGQFSDGTQFWSCNRKCRLPRQLVHFNGDWTTSLTLPDGWEEA